MIGDETQKGDHDAVNRPLSCHRPSVVSSGKGRVSCDLGGASSRLKVALRSHYSSLVQ